MSAAVFLDRDGTLIEEVGYLDRPERVVLYPFAVDALRALNRAGITTVMVTNQSGVARGFFDEAMVDRCHRHIADRVDDVAFLEPGRRRWTAIFHRQHEHTR